MLSNQVRYSLVNRGPERDLIPYAEAKGRIVMAYSPLAQGLLSGRYHEGNLPTNRVRLANPLFLPQNLELASGLIATLQAIADAHKATPAQIALAWSIHSPAVVAIPGASTVAQLESNVAAADIELSEEEYKALVAASDRFHPMTGLSAMPKLARTRLVRRYEWWAGELTAGGQPGGGRSA